jgi:cytochrome d ubiquinol oxidase subunit I
MLFGARRVGPGPHFAAAGLDAAGTPISTFWTIAANSWMQTPAGFTQCRTSRRGLQQEQANE